MNIAIIGFGKQGRSAYDFFNHSGNILTICDKVMPDDVPTGAKTRIGETYLNRLDHFDLLIRGPGVHPRDIVAANDPAILDKVTSNTNEFFEHCPTKNIIGVTGTKGKGTTSTLITKILEQQGKRVHLGGNIGIPPLDLLTEDIVEDDWVVLELANYQLIDLKYSPHIAVCLMVEPEHLDWHTDINEYYEAKTQLFRQQTKNDLAIYFSDNANSKRIASTGAAKLIPYYKAPGAVVAGDHIAIDGEPIIRLGELKILGTHNYQNICAAVTAIWQLYPDAVSIAQVLREFTGLAYRLELRREINDIKYYNDSFASAPPATIAAISAIAGNKVLIVGGRSRGLDLKDLAKAVKKQEAHIRKVILIGESAEECATAFERQGFHHYVINESKDMAEIIKATLVLSKPHDSVILSPGFPSFDMFKNFEERGIKFNDAVSDL